ncbi:MAG TPA: arsenic resistance N-acetyltransferase ArsN2 [Chryseolinea sp.]|nr:arsenic resistance N-acetyltransferase ArsN2 [Chryseolinea sp.]
MNFSPMLIRDAAELKKLQHFLQANNLPYADIKSEGNVFIGYYDAEGNMIASGGLELYGASALLRSVAVGQHYRGKELGKQMVDELIVKAKDLKIDFVFLLTETARAFFLKRGFSDISREDVPGEIKSSSEFSFVCPVSAACMSYRVNEQSTLLPESVVG